MGKKSAKHGKTLAFGHAAEENRDQAVAVDQLKQRGAQDPAFDAVSRSTAEIS